MVDDNCYTNMLLLCYLNETRYMGGMATPQLIWTGQIHVNPTQILQSRGQDTHILVADMISIKMRLILSRVIYTIMHYPTLP